MRGDHSARAPGAVGHRRRDRQLAPAADLHPLHARIPAGDHLALAELEAERLVAIPRRVELLAGRERDAGVVHGHGLPGGRLVTVADDDVLDPEVERDIAFGLVDLGTLG